jgi:hypothetical protein
MLFSGIAILNPDIWYVVIPAIYYLFSDVNLLNFPVNSHVYYKIKYLKCDKLWRTVRMQLHSFAHSFTRIHDFLCCEILGCIFVFRHMKEVKKYPEKLIFFYNINSPCWLTKYAFRYLVIQGDSTTYGQAFVGF